MCKTPLTLWRKHATITGRKTDTVPCGKCFQCLAKRRNDWSFRLYHQMQHSITACFITLTYGLHEKEGWGKDPPLSFNGHHTLDKRDFQLFIKKLRNKNKEYIKKNYGINYKDQQPLKYYAVGEYGTNNHRPHYHLILFNLHPDLCGRSLHISRYTWQMGNVDIANCNLATINYTTSYIMQGTWTPQADDDDREPHFSLMSKGLGNQYLTDAAYHYHTDKLEPTARHPGGFTIALPRYYKDQLFSKSEKQEIAEMYQQFHSINWEDFSKIDYDMEIQKTRYQIKQAENKLKTERQTL